MPRVASPKLHTLTPEDIERIKQLNAESDRILDALFDRPEGNNQKLVSRLNEIDITIAGITGESIFIDNINTTL